MELLISNDKLTEHKSLIDNALTRARYEAQLALDMRKIFRLIGEQFAIVYAERRAVPNIRGFKDDIASTLKMNYVKIARNTKWNLRTKKSDDSRLARSIDTVISQNIERRSKKQSEFIIMTLEDNLHTDLNEIIIEASAQGIPLDKEEIAEKTRIKFVSESVNRSGTIATTEFTGMAEGTKFAEASTLQEANEGVFRKSWRAMLDSVTRAAHIFADGQEVDLYEPFIVGNERMLHVGDESNGASLGNIISCRCETLYTNIKE